MAREKPPHLNIAAIGYMLTRAVVVSGPSNNERQTVCKIVMKYHEVKIQCKELDTIEKNIKKRRKKGLERARWNEIWKEWSG